MKSGKQPSVMNSQQRFAQIQAPRVPRSTFDRSHGWKGTVPGAGQLVPVFIDDALPGDTMNLKTTVFARLNTPLTPIMDNMTSTIHYFSVPLRLLWDNFEKFCGAQVDPGDSIDYLMPTATSTATTGYANESIFDYAGIPTKIPGLEHTTFAFRAINMIWNQYYRDQDLQDSVPENRGDGPDDPTDYQSFGGINGLPRRNKTKDYFTSARPFAQKGEPVSIPLSGTAPIVGFGMDFDSGNDNDNYAQVRNENGDLRALGTSDNYLWGANTAFGTGELQADLSQNLGILVNQLRESTALQKFLELDARGGTRYIEINHSHFGVVSPDARLQRAEFLSGVTRPLNFTPVAQTSATASEPSSLADLAAIATGNMSHDGFVKSFTEHEIVIGLLSFSADLNYQQGLDRRWSRQTRFDMYWPEFAHLGEQAILNKEIYAQGDADQDADAAVFGYQERWAEYKYKPSIITGKMRSNDAASLDVWHLAQEFATAPALNSSFIIDQPPISRIVAAPSEPAFKVDVYHDFKHTRPMPVYSTPGGTL